MAVRALRLFSVSWAVTCRCNLSCAYCSFANFEESELGFDQIASLLEQLRGAGMRILRITGGEPLLREDLPDLIRFARGMGVFTTIATNGILLPDKIEKYIGVEGIFVSIDGMERMNDMIRGKGSSSLAWKAIEAAKRNKIPACIAATMTSESIDNITSLVKSAFCQNVPIFFQPATAQRPFSSNKNIHFADEDTIRQACQLLCSLKSRYKNIVNSYSGLKYFSSGYRARTFRCFASTLFLRISPSGNVTSCSRSLPTQDIPNLVRDGVVSCLRRLRVPACNACTCASLLEANLLASGDLFALVNMVTQFFQRKA